MRNKKIYYNYTLTKRASSSHNWVIFALIYVFAGIQANINVIFIGQSFTVNLLFILLNHLIIQYEWNKVRWYCLTIGLVFDIFTSSPMGISALSLWIIGFLITRIKKAFYVEYISTSLILLFILISGYCFLFTFWNYIAHQINDFMGSFLRLFLHNCVFTMLAMFAVNPVLKVMVNDKISTGR